jgi:hypothetical protein
MLDNTYMHVYNGMDWEVSSMAEKNDKALVLRSVYLERNRDEELREMAHKFRVSKNELIRQLIEVGFRHKEELGAVVAKAEESKLVHR